MPNSKTKIKKNPNVYIGEDYNPTTEEIVVSDDMKDKIEKLLNFFNETGIDYDKYDPEKIPKLTLSAYPNYDAYLYAPKRPDLNKWMNTVRDIYFKEKDGIGRIDAIKRCLAGWEDQEALAFLNWLRFYEGGNHLKYKTAQLWYQNNSPGYFVQIKPEKKIDVAEEIPSPVGRDIDMVRDHVAETMSENEKKQIIERQRNKIIGRLDSAEKLLRSNDGHLFAGKELEALMDAIFSLKKKVHLVNKMSSSVRLYEDMIVREGNVLVRAGFVKAGEMLRAVGNGDAMPMPTGVNPPTQVSGAPGGLPSMGPGMPQNPPESAGNDSGLAVLQNGGEPTANVKKEETAVEKFLENMGTGNITTKEDLADNKDELSVNDELLEVVNEEPEMVVEAQDVGRVAPAGELKAPPTKNVAENSDLEINEEEKVSSVKDIDTLFDAALENITVEDVIKQLEDVSRIFKSRDIPRQLTICDLMLNKLTLAPLFPQMTEILSRSLSDSQYVLIRLDEIISKLRGVSEPPQRYKDLVSPEKDIDPKIQEIKNRLMDSEDKEKQRKDKAKALRNQDLDLMSSEKEVPEIEIEEDLTTKPSTPTPMQKIPNKI